MCLFSFYLYSCSWFIFHYEREKCTTPEFIILSRVLASLSSLPALRRLQLLRWHLARDISNKLRAMTWSRKGLWKCSRSLALVTNVRSYEHSWCVNTVYVFNNLAASWKSFFFLKHAHATVACSSFNSGSRCLDLVAVLSCHCSPGTSG